MSDRVAGYQVRLFASEPSFASRFHSLAPKGRLN